MIVRRGDRYLVEGPVTLESVGALIDEGVALEGASVVVDLAGVTHADSSALSLLLEWVRRFRRGGRQIVFANLSGNLRSLAELYGVIDLIPTAAD
jgi:phospholipid transport system transporter-binding protein